MQTYEFQTGHEGLIIIKRDRYDGGNIKGSMEKEI